MTKVKVSTSWESNIRVKEQLSQKSVLYAFEQNWKIVSLKLDNAIQNCEYINILKFSSFCFRLIRFLSC